MTEAKRSLVYLDNNATTIMPHGVIKCMTEWCNRGNPSSSHAAAVVSRAMMDEMREYIGKLCGFNTCCREDRDSKSPQVSKRQDPSLYKVIFTSGASESNCALVSGVIHAYAETTGGKPHVVTSSIEHKSILDMLANYSNREIIDVTYVKCQHSGHILPEDVNKAIRGNTCIVCVMHANNETGAINDVRKIGAISHSRGVPFHCDTVQTFGKDPINPVKDNVDSFSISFHKFQGPPGVGALVIKQQLLIGYKLSPMIFGSQNEGLRGGTENLPGIGASLAALKLTMENRLSKNTTAQSLKLYIMKEIGNRMPSRQYVDYVSGPSSGFPIEVVFLSGLESSYLNNTILLAVVKKTGAPVCNGKIKSKLEEKNIIISVGSACNTASAKASHVLFAMGADDYIRKGALRVSLGDHTTLDDAKKFVREFLLIIKDELSK